MADFDCASQTLTASSAVIRLSGDMDAHSFERMEEEFGRALDANVLGLALDISELDSMTSAGLGAVLNLAQALGDRGGGLLVAAPRPKILGLVEMLGVRDALTIVESPDQAKRTAAAMRPA